MECILQLHSASVCTVLIAEMARNNTAASVEGLERELRFQGGPQRAHTNTAVKVVGVLVLGRYI